MTESGSRTSERDRIRETRTFDVCRRWTLSFACLRLTLSDEMLLGEHHLLLRRRKRRHLLLAGEGLLLHRELLIRWTRGRMERGWSRSGWIDGWVAKGRSAVAGRIGELRCCWRRYRFVVYSFRRRSIVVLLGRERLRAIALRRSSQRHRRRRIAHSDVDVAQRLQSFLLSRHSLLLRHIVAQRITSIRRRAPFVLQLRRRLRTRLRSRRPRRYSLHDRGWCSDDRSRLCRGRYRPLPRRRRRREE